MATPSGWIVRAGPYRTQDEAEAAQEWINQSFYDIAHLLVCIRDGIRTPVVSLNGGLPGNIRRLRTARGWSLSELASRVCVTENAVQKLESGVNGPKLTTAIALSQAFGVSLSELVGQSNGKK
jgi:DNA-binding XRE family transcriptional regulator